MVLNAHNFGPLHKKEIISLIQQLESKSIMPIEGLYALYQWAELGYTFLLSIDEIGYLGEQGKSIVHCIEPTIDMDAQWQELNRRSPGFLTALQDITHKLKTNSIRLTGELKIEQHIGKQYSFEE